MSSGHIESGILSVLSPGHPQASLEQGLWRGMPGKGMCRGKGGDTEVCRGQKDARGAGGKRELRGDGTDSDLALSRSHGGFWSWRGIWPERTIRQS